MLKFDDIFGQDAAIETLTSAYSAERLPHAMIFSGLAGVGKFTTAKALAGLFLCEEPKGTSPCGKCESCKLMDSGGHPDFHRVYKELIRFHDKTGKSKGTSISIDVIRAELVEIAAHKSILGRGKVFVIEQAELMMPPAQNALLKTLEEPQGRTLIILITDQADSLLSTVRSRCQTIAFSSLDVKRVESELVKKGVDRALAADAAQLSGGSLGTARKWIEDGVVEAWRELRSRLDRILNGKGGEDLPAWLKSAADAYAEKQLQLDELASKDQASRDGIVLYLRLAAAYFRKQLSTVDDAEALERLCAAIDAIARAEMYIDANVNMTLAFQELSLTLEEEFA